MNAENQNPQFATQIFNIDQFSRPPQIRILFYTDDYFNEVKFDKVSDFGVGRLAELIKETTPSYVQIDLDFLRRHDGGHAANKLTDTLLQQYDEVWIFGLQLSNLPGEPENELTDAEVAAMEVWMGRGGVLITGDHANQREPGADTSLNELLNLGRALGYRIPRAGRLRRWEGEPSAEFQPPPPGNYNTHEPQAGIDIEDLDLDRDSHPQKLVLKQFPVAGKFAPGTTGSFKWRPHPLFCGQAGAIDVFPDHMHEGHLLIPKDNPEWPAALFGEKPMPEVIAWGVDWRIPQLIALVSAYDGDAAKVGRIVADSTWHHYFNYNLMGFPRLSDGSLGYVLRRLANYYVNLAIWLAPSDKRDAMRERIFWAVATNGNVLEVKGASLATIGKTGFAVLGLHSSQCFLSGLLFSDIMMRATSSKDDSLLPPEELILGGIVAQFHKAFRNFRPAEPLPRVQELVTSGVARAFEEFLTEIGSVEAKVRNAQVRFGSYIDQGDKDSKSDL